MTVPAAVTTYRYEGNGVTTIFAYSNRLLTTADVQVQILTRATDAIVETLTLTTDYTVTIVSNSLANITITNALKIPSGTQDLLLSLNLALTQTRSFPRADSLPAADIELGLDKLTLIAQTLNDDIGRSLRFPDSDTDTDGELPAKAVRASTYLAFDADGVPIASASAAGGAPAGAFGATLVAAATQAAALTALNTLTQSRATAASPATIELAEDTDNGANKVTLTAPASLAADAAVTLPAVTSTLATLAGTETLTNKTFAVGSNTFSMAPITNSLGADVALNNISNYFDGPSIAQGTSGTWFVSGTVCVTDTAGGASHFVKLWDGTTVIASARVNTPSASITSVVALSGYLASPAGNLRISVRDTTSTSGKIIFNESGNSKDSTISAIRIA
jgi:hypothetical protein